MTHILQKMIKNNLTFKILSGSIKFNLDEQFQ